MILGPAGVEAGNGADPRNRSRWAGAAGGGVTLIQANRSSFHCGMARVMKASNSAINLAAIVSETNDRGHQGSSGGGSGGWLG
jgi:hypothetical protein